MATSITKQKPTSRHQIRLASWFNGCLSNNAAPKKAAQLSNNSQQDFGFTVGSRATRVIQATRVGKQCKTSKYNRTWGSLVWNGDFRRYLYEALVISMRRCQIDTQWAWNELVFGFKDLFQRFAFGLCALEAPCFHSEADSIFFSQYFKSDVTKRQENRSIH